MLIKPIKFDLNKYRLYEKLKAKQGDTESRFLLFQLLDGSLPFNLENRSVRAYMIKPDGKEVFNDLIINDRIKGYCTLELTNQVLAAPGTVKLELMVIEGTKKLTSSVFELEVDKSINSEKSIISTNEFTALLNGLASLNEYDNYKNEIKNARGGQSNLKKRLDGFDAHLENIDTNKVGKGQNESVGWSMLDQEVKLKFTGDKVAVVEEDAINTIHIVDGANTINKLDRNIIEYLYDDKIINVFNAEKVKNGMVFDSVTGELKSSTTGCYLEYIPVIEGTTMIKNGTFGMDTVFLDGNKNKLTENFVITVRNQSFKIPVGAKYMSISTAIANAPTLMIVAGTKLPKSYVGYLKGYDKTKVKNVNEIEALYKIIDGNSVTNLFNKNSNIMIGQYYNKDGVLSSASNYRGSELIRVKGFKKLIKTGTYSSNITFWNEEENFISGAVITNNAIEIPEEAYWCRASMHMDYLDSFMLLNNDYMIDGYLKYLESTPKYLNRRLKDLKMCTIGHSLTQQERWQPTVVKELGMKGYTSLATYGGYMVGQICNNIADVPEDCNVITMWVGTNDYANNKTLGEFGDTDKDLTYYGALDYVIKYASTNYPTKKLIFITDMIRDNDTDKTFASTNGVDKYGNQKNNNGNTLLDFVNAVLEVCGNNGVLVYDNYRRCGINKYNLDSFSDDRLHLSVKGGVFWGKQFAKFLECNL